MQAQYAAQAWESALAALSRLEKATLRGDQKAVELLTGEVERLTMVGNTHWKKARWFIGKFKRMTLALRRGTLPQKGKQKKRKYEDRS